MQYRKMKAVRGKIKEFLEAQEARISFNMKYSLVDTLSKRGGAEYW